jgi:hypothetical protein
MSHNVQTSSGQLLVHCHLALVRIRNGLQGMDAGSGGRALGGHSMIQGDKRLRVELVQRPLADGAAARRTMAEVSPLPQLQRLGHEQRLADQLHPAGGRVSAWYEE